MTKEQRERRRLYMREYQRRKAAEETPQEREERLYFQRIKARVRLMNETPEQREKRLKRQREYKRRQRAMRRLNNDL